MMLPVQSCGYVIPFRTVHHNDGHKDYACTLDDIASCVVVQETRASSATSVITQVFPRLQCRANPRQWAPVSPAMPRVFVDPRWLHPGLGRAWWQRRKYACQRTRCLALGRLLLRGRTGALAPAAFLGEPGLHVPWAEKQARHLWFYDYPL